MFIDKTDLFTLILEDELDEITRADNTIVLASIAAAEAEVRAYLYDSFDVDIIFAKTALARNQMLVNIVANIAIYHICARCQAGQDLAYRTDRYDRAMSIIKQTIKTEYYPDLERRPLITAQKHIMYGGATKRSNRY
jgi:Protein of unknown function (DUF1320)